jgi:uncharacterized protein (TIGR03437 family)
VLIATLALWAAGQEAPKQTGLTVVAGGKPIPDRSAAALTPGVAVTISLPQVSRNTLFVGDFAHSIVIPSGTTKATFELRALTSGVDIDLFVRRGAEPALQNGRVVADYIGDSLTGNETIVIPSPAPATYFIGYGIYTPNASAVATIRVLLEGPTTSCQYSLTPPSATIPSAGGQGSVQLSTSAGCAWSVTSTVSWVQVTSPAGGSGSAAIAYNVLANNGSASRSGALMAAGQTHTIVQAAPTPCAYSLSPTSGNVPASGGNVTVTVTAPAGCSWTVTNLPTWIRLTSAGSGTGPGSFTLAISANTSEQRRSGTVTVAGQTFTVEQSGIDVCVPTLSPTGAEFWAAGGVGDITVQSPAQCRWSVSSSASWITITSGASGSGNAEVRFRVAANFGSVSRSGAIRVGPAEFRISQTWGEFSVINTASAQPGPMSPLALVTLVGARFSGASEGSSPDSPSHLLAGTGVALKDGDGVEHSVRLLMVSPERIHMVVPFTAAGGAGTISVKPADGPIQTSPVRIENSAPGLFSADGSGVGPAVGSAQNLDGDGRERLSIPLSRYDEARQQFLPAQIRMGSESQRTVVTMQGTGFRFSQDLKVRAGNVDCEVVSYGESAEDPLLDSVRFVLPRSLAGRGDLPVSLLADGRAANPVMIHVAANLPLPRLTAVTPAALDAGATASLRITGTNLDGSQLRIDPPEDIELSDVVVSAGVITATATVSRTAAAGNRGLLATNELGDSNRLALNIRPLPVTITTVTPSSRPRGSEPFSLRIEGDNLDGTTAIVFTPSTGISVGSLEVTPSSVTATVQISADAPLGRRTVAVRTPSGLSNTLPFEVLAAPPPLPVLSSITPTFAEVSQLLADFRLSGQNLGSAPTVTFEPSQGITILARSASGGLFLQIGNDAVPGERQVTVSTTAGRSNAVPFTIRAKSGNFTISNLRATQPTGFNGDFTLTVDFNDPSGAAAGGVNFAIDLPDLGFLATSFTPQGTVTGRTSGTIQLTLSARNASRIGRVRLSLVNPLGHRSNLLEGAF